VNVVTLGGLVVGLCLLAHTLVRWWPKKVNRKSLMALLPYVFSLLYGMLLILCAGGIVGWVADVALWGANWGGDAALVWGVGGQAGDDVSRGGGQVLTNGGHAVVLILTAAVVALLRKRVVSSGDVLTGAMTGVCLGLVKGIAGAAAVPLATTVNLAGAWMSTQTLS